MSAPTTPRDILTQLEAEARAARITDVRYAIALDLTPGSPTYAGKTTITFAATGDGDTFFDFRGKTIHSFTVNGTTIDPEWTGYRLTLPASALAATNTAVIEYENEYDHTGDGFHQFIDPEDQQEYLYTNFEPYSAHRLFPGFDQPDIKARYSLSVTAPEDWTLIANSPETSCDPAGNGRFTRAFAETKPFSTYLFALIAGPYAAAKSEHNGIPIGLYCRRSLLKHLDEEELFTITRQGLDFLGEFFDYPYAFGKYDQVWVPEFNAGAMENVGAVTHHESMIFRDPPTENQRRRRAEVILHEMAHMWFGNLVTMRWWKDLWLNESFATYMAYLTMEKATRFRSAWQDFSTSIKNWAYRQDQLVTTHPIAGEVADTDETFLNFDGITYGKGASVIKQLVSTIGMSGFRDGMRQYFKRHEYGNASLNEFLKALEEGSGRELGEWSAKWLETASLNTIAATWQSDGERLTALSLTQTAPDEYPTIRPHHLELGLITEKPEGLRAKVIPVHLEEESCEVPFDEGTPRPALVYPNFNDHAYAKVSLDPESISFVRANMERVDDPLLRQQLWSSLWNMVRDQQLASPEFLALVRSKLPQETDLELVDAVLGQAQGALGRFVPASLRDEEAHRLFEATRTALETAPPGDARIIWGRTMLSTAVAAEDLEFIGALADDKAEIEGFELDQDMRWNIAIRHTAYGMPGARRRVNEEAKRDPSDRGARAQLQAAVSPPESEVKADAWEKFHGDGYGSLYLTGAAMGGFNWTHQAALLDPYVERFFAGVNDIFDKGQREFSSQYFGSLFPGYRVERGILERSQVLLAEVDGSNPVLARMLREANDDLERAIKCREYAESVT